MKKKYLQNATLGTFQVIQWLSLHAFNAGGMGLIPGWGNKIPHATWPSKKQTNYPNSEEELHNLY